MSYADRADGLRVSKSNSSSKTLYRYDGQMGIQDVEFDGSGTLQKAIDHAIGARGVDGISTTTSSGTSVAYPLYDAHGNMISTLSRAGSGYSYSSVRSFDAWGGVRQGSATGDPKGRYCASLGHKQDDESGLVYMRARYYEPDSGRFISQDKTKNGVNWYRYCSSDPINRIDKDGQLDYEDLFHIFTNASEEFVQGLKAAWETGSIDEVIQFIVDNYARETMLFSTGGIWRNLSTGYGIHLRIEAIMLEELLEDGVIESVGNGIIECETELSGIGNLVKAATTAHEITE